VRQGSAQVTEKARPIVVVFIEGEPAHSGVDLPEPGAEQGGLAKAGRGGDEDQPGARL
jgi:hypothetical protein